MDIASLLRLFLLAAIRGGAFLFMRISASVFGTLWGVIFLNEIIDRDKATGGLLVLAGIALTTRLVKLPVPRSA